MADAIVVCLAARPRLQTLPKRRRLALALVPRPGSLEKNDRGNCMFMIVIDFFLTFENYNMVW